MARSSLSDDSGKFNPPLPDIIDLWMTHAQLSPEPQEPCPFSVSGSGHCAFGGVVLLFVR